MDKIPNHYINQEDSILLSDAMLVCKAMGEVLSVLDDVSKEAVAQRMRRAAISSHYRDSHLVLDLFATALAQMKPKPAAEFRIFSAEVGD